MYKMPKHVGRPRGRRRPVKRRGPVRRGERKGKGVKASDVLGGISATALGASTLGFTAPFLLPVAGITGIASGLARLFGAGGLTQQQVNVLMRAEKQGLVIGKRPGRVTKPGVKRRRKR